MEKKIFHKDATHVTTKPYSWRESLTKHRKKMRKRNEGRKNEKEGAEKKKMVNR